MQVVTRRLVALGVVVPAIAAMLVGCTQPPPNPTPTHAPTAQRTPAFASDEEALKAATDAYAAYLKMSDTILAEGAKHPDRFKQVATGDALKAAIEDVTTYKQRGLRITGNTAFDSTRIQLRTDGPTPSVSIYVCDDVSNIDVIDSSGQSLVKPDRNPRTPFVVTAVIAGPSKTLVSDRTLWEGKDFC